METDGITVVEVVGTDVVVVGLTEVVVVLEFVVLITTLFQHCFTVVN